MSDSEPLLDNKKSQAFGRKAANIVTFGVHVKSYGTGRRAKGQKALYPWSKAENTLPYKSLQSLDAMGRTRFTEKKTFQRSRAYLRLKQDRTAENIPHCVVKQASTK